MPGVSDARRLAGALEPIAGQAQFSPECHRNDEALGFPPSPGRAGLTALPDRCAFFRARGAVLGDVPADRLREFRGDSHDAGGYLTPLVRFRFDDAP